MRGAWLTAAVVVLVAPSARADESWSREAAQLGERLDRVRARVSGLVEGKWTDERKSELSEIETKKRRLDWDVVGPLRSRKSSIESQRNHVKFLKMEVESVEREQDRIQANLKARFENLAERIRQHEAARVRHDANPPHP